MVVKCAMSKHGTFLRFQLSEGNDGTVTLSISNVAPDDKGLYTVRATNSLGEAKCFSHVIIKSLSSMEPKPSADVHLEDKHEAPSFSELFTDKTVFQGQSVKFECIAKGKPAPKVGSFFFFCLFSFICTISEMLRCFFFMRGADKVVL